MWVDAWTILELPESPILKVYPWHGAAAPLPPDALFVAAYNVFVGIDSFAEAAFLIQDGKVPAAARQKPIAPLNERARQGQRLGEPAAPARGRAAYPEAPAAGGSPSG